MVEKKAYKLARHIHLPEPYFRKGKGLRITYLGFCNMEIESQSFPERRAESTAWCRLRGIVKRARHGIQDYGFSLSSILSNRNVHPTRDFINNGYWFCGVYTMICQPLWNKFVNVLEYFLLKWRSAKENPTGTGSEGAATPATPQPYQRPSVRQHLSRGTSG